MKKLFNRRILFLLTFVLVCSCQEKEEPYYNPFPTYINFSLEGSSEYVPIPKDASYAKALESGSLTLSSTIKASDGLNKIVARWYLINEEGGQNEKVYEEKLLPQVEADSYTSTFTLTEDQYKALFNKTWKERHFYCVFSANSIGPDNIPYTFPSDTLGMAMAIPNGFKVLRIDTVNGEEPDCEYVSPPPGNNGAGIKNCTKVPGRLRVSCDGKVLFDSGDYVENESGMTLKIRGNTSAYGKQKPYKIKLQKKHDLLERGDEKKYEDKDWILIRSQNNLNTFLGLECARFLGFDWVPAMEYVNVIVNDDYRGLYCLCEPFTKNQSCKADISDTGFLFEKDAYWWNEPKYFDTGYYVTNMKYTFKYPAPEDISSNSFAYLKEYMTKAEKSVGEGTYGNYLDIESFARWLLFHDIWATLDCAGSNIYLMKKDMLNTSKVEMMSPWDFDSLYWNSQMTNKWSNQHDYGALLPYYLLRNSNRDFVHKYKEIWKEVHDKVYPYMSEKVLQLETEYGEAMFESRKLNCSRWGGAATRIYIDRQKMDTWFKGQIPWLEKNIPNL